MTVIMNLCRSTLFDALKQINKGVKIKVFFLHSIGLIRLIYLCSMYRLMFIYRLIVNIFGSVILPLSPVFV